MLIPLLEVFVFILSIRCLQGYFNKQHRYHNSTTFISLQNFWKHPNIKHVRLNTQTTQNKWNRRFMHLSSPAVLYRKTSQNQVDNSAYLSVINSVCIFCVLLSSFSMSLAPTLNMNYFCNSRSNAFGEISKSARLSKQLQRLYSI